MAGGVITAGEAATGVGEVGLFTLLLLDDERESRYDECSFVPHRVEMALIGDTRVGENA